MITTSVAVKPDSAVQRIALPTNRLSDGAKPNRFGSLRFMADRNTVSGVSRIAQLARAQPRRAEVPGSNPGTRTQRLATVRYGDVAQLVEPCFASRRSGVRVPLLHNEASRDDPRQASRTLAKKSRGEC